MTEPLCGAEHYDGAVCNERVDHRGNHRQTTHNGMRAFVWANLCGAPHPDRAMHVCQHERFHPGMHETVYGDMWFDDKAVR